ncbi:hypothetical protein TSAR_009945 [Trichomalopsis sarcophagae]|uniref:Uncharacterized protein n=1 Tax=Trichomalopsis sarcophagae TaxID=543379 RepID=A0A232F4Z3_9HYME|nr:hypothetical protein TSAR_009945 [Trichomalopsis sarcophagae]
MRSRPCLIWEEMGDKELQLDCSVTPGDFSLCAIRGSIVFKCHYYVYIVTCAVPRRESMPFILPPSLRESRNSFPIENSRIPCLTLERAENPSLGVFKKKETERKITAARRKSARHFPSILSLRSRRNCIGFLNAVQWEKI